MPLHAAYCSRWRRVTPAAKGLLALAGMVAAYAAVTPVLAVALALAFTGLTLAISTPLTAWRRLALAPLTFLLLGSASLLLSLNEHGLQLVTDPATQQLAAVTASRSLAVLAALLFLLLTTPLPDLIHLLRRLRCPALLVDMLVVAYRLLFVLNDRLAAGRAAQAVRLGQRSRRHAMRGLGLRLAQLTLGLWQRAHALHLSSSARLGDGDWRALPPAVPHPRRDLALAVTASALLLVLARYGAGT